MPAKCMASFHSKKKRYAWKIPTVEERNKKNCISVKTVVYLNEQKVFWFINADVSHQVLECGCWDLLIQPQKNLTVQKKK